MKRKLFHHYHSINNLSTFLNNNNQNSSNFMQIIRNFIYFSSHSTNWSKCCTFRSNSARFHTKECNFFGLTASFISTVEFSSRVSIAVRIPNNLSRERREFCTSLPSTPRILSLCIEWTISRCCSNTLKKF